VIFRFGDYELDPAVRELRCGSTVVPVQPKALDLLVHLLRNRLRAVARDEVLRVVWPDVRVTPASVARALKSARRAIGDDGRRQAWIRTLADGAIRFVGEVAEAETGPEPALAGIHYVGRADTLLHLRERLRGACAGRGGVLLLVGEAGIGKTRTAMEVLAWAESEGAAAVVCHAHGGDATPSFWPWRSLLLRLGTDEVAAPDEGGARSVDAARLRLFAALRSVLERAAERAPLVVLLDDLHDADEGSITLLDTLVPDVAQRSILVLATVRPEETWARAPAAHALGRLVRRMHVERVAIAPLTSAEVAALAARRAGGPLTESDASRLAELTAGNPLWVEEVLRDALRRAGGEGIDWSSVLSSSLERTIGARFAELSEPVQRWLGAGAVLGSSFDPGLASHVAETPDAAGVEALVVARSRHLLAAADDDAASRVRFAHPLYRDVLYGRLPPLEREALHERAARRFETLVGAGAVEEAAHHLLAAGDRVPAAHAARGGARGGELAEQAGAFDRAADLYERSLRRLGDVPTDPKAACELALALARVQRRLGIATAEEPAARALRLARDHRWPRLFAEAALGFAGPMDGYRAPRGEITALLEEALAMVGPDNRDLRARLLARFAAEEAFAPGGGRRNELGRDAVIFARNNGDPLLEAEVVDTPFSGIVESLDFGERLELAERLLRSGLEAKRDGVVLHARLLLVFERLFEGDREAFDTELARAEALARARRDPISLYRIQLYLATRALLAGEAERSEELSLAAFAMAGHGRFEGAAGFLGAQLVLARVARGRAGEAVQGLERDAPLRPGPAARCFLAWAYAEAGDAERCRQTVREIAERDLATFDRFAWFTANAAMLARACWFARERGPADVLGALLARARGRVAVRGGLAAHGPVSHALALLAALRGEKEEAAALFDEAAALAGRMRAPLWLAQIEKDRA
jgi:DNA-binding winged helix-turn-helix (wHTH) protein